MRRLLSLVLAAAWLLSPLFGGRLESPSGPAFADPITTAFDRWVADDVRSAAKVLGDLLDALPERAAGTQSPA